MQVTMRHLVEGWTSLQKLAQVEAGNGLTIKQAWVIGKVARAAEVEVKQLEELRAKLFQSYGETVGEEQQIKPEHVKSFTAQMEEMLEQVLHLPGEAIRISELAADLPLSAAHLARLDWLITEG